MIPLHFQWVKVCLEESCPGMGVHFKKNSDMMVGSLGTKSQREQKELGTMRT